MHHNFLKCKDVALFTIFHLEMSPSKVSEMEGRRVLFLGVTGVGKGQVLSRLKEHCQAAPYSRSCEVIDFDSDYIFNVHSGPHGQPKDTFLDSTEHTQCKDWRDNWDYLQSNQLKRLMKTDSDIFLGVHGCILREHYGVRSVVAFDRLAAFKPHVIVILIADIYDMWWTTQERSTLPLYGLPTLEHLLTGRRFETVIANQCANFCSTVKGTPGRPKALLVAVAHPKETLARAIYQSSPLTVYLSFPISAPRDLCRAGDDTGIEQVSAFVKKAYEWQTENPRVVAFCPLAIDELPVVSEFERLYREAQTTNKEFVEVPFDRDKHRWSLQRFWAPESRLAAPVTMGRPLKREDIESVGGGFITDVSWRDYRLVEQSQCLAVFNPVFKRPQGTQLRVSTSVHEEIEYARELRKPVFIFQDESHDPGKSVLHRSYPELVSKGTMSPGPGAKRIIECTSVGDMFQQISTYFQS